MRLLDTAASRETPKVQEFPANQIPPYAILSHTWGDDEITFADLSDPDVTQRPGYSKIRNACEKALGAGHGWMWIDTCCIDKSSSAELSEAINSMFNWYGAARTCFVYLRDVPFEGALEPTASGRTPFSKSTWFTRGWTLQELLSPAHVSFYSADWCYLGSKGSLESPISRTTDIPKHVLRDGGKIFSESISRRMSWAAWRKTTRTEDIAYCLMGLFDVNMPMLYGEGHKAFRRLQEEIMKNSTDQTLFAWDPSHDDPPYLGMLARHPVNFRASGGFSDQSDRFDTPPASINPKGITLSCFLRKEDGGEFSATLKCVESLDPDRFAVIRLVQAHKERTEYRKIKSQLQTSHIRGMQGNILIHHVSSVTNSARLQEYYFTVDLAGLKVDSGVSLQAYALAPIMEGQDYCARKDLSIGSPMGSYMATDLRRSAYVMPILPNQRALDLSVLASGGTNNPLSTDRLSIRVFTKEKNRLRCEVSLNGKACPLVYGDEAWLLKRRFRNPDVVLTMHVRKSETIPPSITHHQKLSPDRHYSVTFAL